MRHLLIDSKNMLYRAIFAGDASDRFKQSKHHPAKIVLHFLHEWRITFKPDKIHIFWDADRTDTWRREIAQEYKNHRKDKPKLNNAQDSLKKLSTVCIELFEAMGFYQYYRPKMEADDLIYAFCRSNRKDDIVIISSDGDLMQIPYLFSNVKVHNPLTKNKYEPIPQTDPVFYKALVGDKSDNISGYHGVGKVTATKLCNDRIKQEDFFNSDKACIKEGDETIIVGNRRFKDNLKIVDLGLCPNLADNLLYILKKQAKTPQFNSEKIMSIIVKRKLRGVTAEIHRYISPFKHLGVQNGS